MKSLRFLFLACLLLGTAAQAQTAKPDKPILADRIVAVVNDEAITLNELNARLTSVERQLRTQGTPLPPHEVLEKQVLERMVMDDIQLQYAKETSTQVDDGQLDAALQRIATANHLSLPEFRAALEKDGVTWAKFREEIRDEMIITKLREREVDSRITVSDGEVDNYLASPEYAAGANEELNLSHILLRVPEQASPEQLASIHARAEQALAQIKRGDDFARVAASYSDAPDALSGGAIGFRPLNRLPSLYVEAAAKLQPGEVSGIVRSPAGFHIVKLIARRGGALQEKTVVQTHARHILIKVNELVSDADAKRKLLDIRERLEHGADFAELARLYSNDLSAAKGGDLGWLYPGDTVPEFQRAMDALKINEISQPVRTQFGWHLIQVLGRRVEDVSPERKRQLARQALRERKSDEAYEDWLRQMRDRAYVEYRLDDK
ncbi:chaperone SurA precursor [mine drainage metagenome]|uniref:Chaperone SurA n=1 Tax=mine drainage metagenome TaxID=410659 RepID=A0A1J5QIA4_9ZZZZ